MPTVRDGNVILDITLIRPPTPGAVPPAPAGGEFLSWWKSEAKVRGMAPPRLTGADRAIARRLTAKHGLKQLENLAVHYFRRHAANKPEGAFEMVLFSSRIPVIETELKDQAV